MKISDLGEFNFIRHISECLNQKLPKEVTGIGDDCAVVPLDKENALLLTTDQLIENVHFVKELLKPYELGYKSLAVNLSDIAAMGGKPLYALLSLGMPVNLDIEWTDQFINGLKELAHAENVFIIGGDTTRSPGPIFISLTVIGKCAASKIKRRSSAKPGDVVCCTGFVGDSGAGLKILLENLPANPKLIEAHCSPRAQLKEGMWLAEQSGVHAMMDLSDGINSDVQRIMEASHCGAQIDLDRLPLSKVFLEACEKYDWMPQELGVISGEDYHLLVTIDPEAYSNISKSFENEFKRPLYEIGKIIKGSELVYLKGDVPYELRTTGFEHF